MTVCLVINSQSASTRRVQCTHEGLMLWCLGAFKRPMPSESIFDISSGWLLQHRLFDRILDEAAEYQRSTVPSRVRNVAFLGDIFNKLLEIHFEDVSCDGEVESHSLDASLSSAEGSNFENAHHCPKSATKAKTTFRWRGRRGRGI